MGRPWVSINAHAGQSGTLPGPAKAPLRARRRKKEKSALMLFNIGTNVSEDVQLAVLHVNQVTHYTVRVS